MEIWKDVEEYEGLYQVSNMGRVKSCKRVIMRNNGKPQTINEKYLKPSYDKCGYMVVNLWKNNKFKQKKLHQIIAQAFIPNPENKPYIDHINCNTSDNRLENLRWVTHKENMNNPLTKNKMSKTHKWLCANDEQEKTRLDFVRNMRKIKKVA